MEGQANGRTVRIAPQLWEQAERLAKHDGTTVEQTINRIVAIGVGSLLRTRGFSIREAFGGAEDHDDLGG